MSSLEPNTLYGQHYYRHYCGEVPYGRSPEWLGFFGYIAGEIQREVQPSNALDVGCAFGFLVEALRKLGVEAYGLDVSQYAIEQVHEDTAPYCRVGSILDPLERRYDLIVCIEVLEHLSHEDGIKAVDNICKATDNIIFSSTPEDYREYTHLNVQPPEYWASLFASRGFVRDFDWDVSFISPWAVRFRREQRPLHQLIRPYERRLWLLQKENRALREELISTRAKAAEQEQREASLRATLEARDAEPATIDPGLGAPVGPGTGKAARGPKLVRAAERRVKQWLARRRPPR